ncbi:MAG: RecQ family ATP-dependent DNA helicase [Flavobacteriales bacterium]|nr:RecQ family ATP-dependent DNA helicase [Flavobacteriales bacterium]
MNLTQILTRYWGYDKFRPLQEEVIQSVMAGKDTFALMPTGGGKSVCYQVPALASDGICIVVSPLIALMKDQVEALKKKGIEARALFSGMSYREMDITLDNCVYGRIKLLYLSPERLASDLVKARVAKMKVNLLAVDEAHCISQWGYDFRPAYRNIASLRELIPNTPVLAVTATATQPVIEDILKQLRFSGSQIFRKSFHRENLAYEVREEEDKQGRLLKLCREWKGSGIVYVRTRRRTKEMATLLSRSGIVSDHYHGGLTQAERRQKQDAWMKGQVRVIVCTNAFGMGIDKSNVRFVVHMDIPDSMEAYVQEAGRAGRDEEPARAIIFHNAHDRLEMLERVKASYPPFSEIKVVYQALGNYFQLPVGSGLETSFDFDLGDFSQRFSLKVDLVFHAMQVLERAGYITMVESIYLPSRILFKVDQKGLYAYQVAHQQMDAFIKLLLRSYPGLFDQPVPVREEELARRMNSSVANVVALLQRLVKEDVIEYFPRKESPQVFYNLARLDEKNLVIAPEFLKQRRDQAMERAEYMVFYLTSKTRCRSQMILAYFGEKETQRCGVCDICQDRNDLGLNELEFERVSEMVKEILTGENMALNELVEKVEGPGDDHVIKVLQWLMDHGKIRLNQENKLQWVS